MANRDITDPTATTDKTTPVGADRFPIIDSETNPDSYKEISYTNLLAAVLANAPYVLTAYLGAAVSPADATTYYFGPFPGAGLGTTDGNNRIYIPRGGTVTRIDLFANCSGGASNETSTISFRLNGTTDTAISATFALDAPPVIINNTSISVAVVAGDYFNIKWVSPTWATNPVNVNITVQVYISG